MKCSGGIYLIRFNTGGGIQVKEHRLYSSQEEAQAAIPGNSAVKEKEYRVHMIMSIKKVLVHWTRVND
ncbi:hypothetical protein [Anaerosacchariphilus polymeriproducens]|uniref:hypothetical protein n=1 Tax=Anaerosacchariphilus polymeriproducens TaxID=1812858 RepID=UPI00195F8354|nr:hypothetical protein [Anaerosacchariphilus polymeriproducens]